jgi:hypothetical protein
MEGENVGMGRDAGMELPLASLIVLVSFLLDALDGIFNSGLGVVLVSKARSTTPNAPAPKMDTIVSAPLSMVCPRNRDADVR